MVDFDTRIFSEQGGQVIGCEVTVYSDQGDKIGNIVVTDAASITELQQRLAVIDETYFTEERLQAILANSQETTNINATSLNGFVSSDFAKVNQLSNYAPVSHNHSISQITGLYDYQITASSYNVDIDTDVTITVKVTNRATGQPVVGVTVPVLKNNQSWKSGTTGVNGTFSLTYTADTWGLVMFSTKTHNTSINVTGWKKVVNQDDGKIQVYCNGETCQFSFQGSVSIRANGNTNFSAIPSQYAPSQTITSQVHFQGHNISCMIDSEGAIGVHNASTSTSVLMRVLVTYSLKSKII